MNIGGLTLMGGSTLRIEVGPVSDKVIMANNASLSGELAVSLADGFSPSLGQSFTLLTGNMVTGTEPNGLVVIAQLQPISVVFSIPQDSVSAVMKRMQSGDKLPVDAWDREQKTRLATGVLASVDNLVDPTTGTVKLKAEFANADNALFPNQFVNVRMKLDTLRDATVIPAAAIQRGAQGMFVYVVKPDQTVTVRPVKLGPVDGQRIGVADGLSPGEVVVIDGMDRLREGATVEVTERPEFKPPPDGQGAGKGMRRGKGDGSGKRGPAAP